MKIFTKYYWLVEEIIFLTILAIPPSIVCLTEGIQIKISNIFIGRISGENFEKMLSALFIGQVVTAFTSYPISQGLTVYVNILCSQAYGAKQYKLVGLYFYRALFMAALTFFPLSTLFMSVRPIVYSFTQDPELAYHAGSYTSTFCLGLPAYFYFKIALRFLQAQNIVWPPLLYLLLGNILNGILQYVLIVQYNTSLAGAAGGYVISLYLIALLFYAQIRFTRVHLNTYVSWSVELIGEWYHTARYTLFPILQTFSAIISSNLIPLILLGLVYQDSTQIAIYSIFYSIWFIFGLVANGFASAITVRVGNLLGANEPKRAFRAAIFSLFYGETFLLLLCSSLFVSSQFLSHLFTTDPTFASNLEYSIKCVSFVMIADIELLSQGIMNSCCMQKLQAFIRFMIKTILAISIAILFTHFVQWKAISIIISNGICALLCFLIAIMIISFRNWESIAHNVSENTQMINLEDELDTRPQNGCLQSFKHMNMCGSSMYNSKVYEIGRYCLCFVVGILVFVFVFVTFQLS